MRFLSFSRVGTPDTVIYPDSRKLATGERHRDGFHMRIVYGVETDVDYWVGEEPPERP